MIKCKICGKLYRTIMEAQCCEDSHSFEPLKKASKTRKQKKIKKWLE